MTRQEFIDGVNTYDDLLDFCADYDLDVCEDIIDCDELDSYLTDEIKDYICYEPWEDLRDRLNEINTGYDWYYRRGNLDYVPADGDFDEYKNDTLFAMDDGRYWDEDEEDDEEPLRNESVIQYSDIIPIEDEPLSIEELISASNAQISTITNGMNTKKETVDVEIETFIGIKTTIKGGN